MPLGRDKFSGFIEIYWNLLKSIGFGFLGFPISNCFWNFRLHRLQIPWPSPSDACQKGYIQRWRSRWLVFAMKSWLYIQCYKHSDQPLHFTIVLENGVDSPTATNHCLSFTLSRRWSILRSCSWKQEMCSMSLCVSIKCIQISQPPFFMHNYEYNII